MPILFIDNRASIVEKVKALGIKAIYGDYFQEALRVPNHVLCTASNPLFTFGGGIDAQFLLKLPYYCEEKRRRGGDNERIGNICFVISVDRNIQASEELVRKALQFAIENTREHETLCICGIGTAIGFLDEFRFTEILKEVLKEYEII